MVAEVAAENSELKILSVLSSLSSGAPGNCRVEKFLDSFNHRGPNGVHQCVVLGVYGPSVFTVANSYRMGRLPGSLAHEISKQLVDAIGFLHDSKIAHGGVFIVI